MRDGITSEQEREAAEARGHIFQPSLRFSSGIAGALFLVGLVAGLAAAFTPALRSDTGSFGIAAWALAAFGTGLCWFATRSWEGDVRWAAAGLGALPLAYLLLMTFGVERT